MSLNRNGARIMALVGLALGIAAADAAGAVVNASILIREGDSYGGSTVTGVNPTYTDGNGKPGLVAILADGRRMIFYDNGPVFFSDDFAPNTLTGGEATMDVSNTGNFLYSPSWNGGDSVVNENGRVAGNGDPAPGVPGQFLTFASRPRMAPDGTMYFMSGLNPTQGSTTTQNRIFYKVDPTGTTFTPLYIGGTTVVDGLTVLGAGAIDFDYGFSNDNSFVINVMNLNTGSTANDTHVVLNGSIKLQEGGATGQGDGWQNFDMVEVNNSGNWIVTGDTNGPVATDEFVAFNGIIGVREGDIIDGVQIPSGASVNGASLNNLDQVVHLWSQGSTFEALFVGHGSNLAASTLLLQLGDLLDLNNDSIPDVELLDFNASGIVGPPLDLADDGYLFLDVDLRDLSTGAEFEAVIRIAIPAPGSVALLGLGGLAGLRRRR